jgi:F plasmid transfer operon, TraF, protein
MRKLLSLALLFLAISLGVAARAEAQQPFESVGNRALGMAGAFVAVADDATAVYWNPAGLATGAKLGATIGWTRSRSGKSNAAPSPGLVGQTSAFTSIGSLPMGLSYGRLRNTVLTTGSAGATGLHTFETTQYGLTILQSVSRGVVLGSTLKYVRGGLATGVSSGATTSAVLDDGLKLTGSKSGAFDLDVGLMIDMKRLRLGLTTRNLREPAFRDNAGNVAVLTRQSRAGLALLPNRRLTFAVDADLETVALPRGPRRMLAVGGEGRVSSKLAIRGGARWNLAIDRGIRQLVASGGASLTIRSGLWLEGFYAQGRFDGDRGFGVGIRAGS